MGAALRLDGHVARGRARCPNGSGRADRTDECQEIINRLNADIPHQAPLNQSLKTTDSTFGQLLRFGIVGVGVNLVLYAAYLAMVGAQVGVKVAMSVAYAFGVMLGFVLNRRWSFGRSDDPRADVLPYLAVYIAGYLLNLSALVLFVDVIGFAHEVVQAVMVFVVAALTFLLQKYWVFRDSGRPTERRT